MSNIIKKVSLMILFLIIISLINIKLYKYYQTNNNVTLSKIINNIKEKYPNVSEEEIISIINSDNTIDNNFLLKYGIDNNKSLVKSNENIYQYIIILNIIIYILFIIFILVLDYMKNNKRKKELLSLTSYLKKLNKKKYNYDIENISDNELSILKDEIYKFAVYLNTQTNNLLEDKIALKNSITDISHQLRTPLSCINISLELIKDNPNMKDAQRIKLINDIYRKIFNINFLVENLLKLSKFDSNTVVFNTDSYLIYDILLKVKDNLSYICDLKNISINIKGNKKETLYCDFKWEVEAISNIVKNSIEHSFDNSSIDINFVKSEVMTKITITDYGKGIDKKDLKNIFKRFYKGKNSSENSIGVGLNLALNIISKDSGNISVESKVNKYTKFTIRYLNNK